MQAKGFTLVELLVVMAILTVLMALVGPWSVERYEKNKASNEWYRFVLWVKSAQQLAFLSSAEASLSLNGKVVSLSHNGKLVEHNWQYVFFEPQHLIININGISDVRTIEGVVLGQRKLLYLNTQDFLIQGPAEE